MNRGELRGARQRGWPLAAQAQQKRRVLAVHLARRLQ